MAQTCIKQPSDVWISQRVASSYAFKCISQRVASSRYAYAFHQIQTPTHSIKSVWCCTNLMESRPVDSDLGIRYQALMAWARPNRDDKTSLQSALLLVAIPCPCYMTTNSPCRMTTNSPLSCEFYLFLSCDRRVSQCPILVV